MRNIFISSATNYIAEQVKDYINGISSDGAKLIDYPSNPMEPKAPQISTTNSQYDYTTLVNDYKVYSDLLNNYYYYF